MLSAQPATAAEYDAPELTREQLNLRRTPVVEAVEKVGPSVVNISTEKVVKRRVSPFSQFRDDFFDEFFDPFFDRYQTRDYKQKTLGSGVIIDPRGYVLTNEHVILRASDITVTLPDDSEHTAHVVGADPKFDLAILKIDSDKEFPAAETGDSDTLMIGETVIAIGNPFGLGHTVTTGVLSAVGRSINTSDGRVLTDFLQTDASINPGNSGGPLLDINGEIIGINTAIYADAEGIGFAIPINRAMRAVSELIRFGEIKRTWTGMRVQQLDPRLAKHFGMDGTAGALVADIIEDGPAEKAGIRQGDVIIAIEGKKVSSPDELKDRLATTIAGEKLEIQVLRDGRKLTLTYTVEAVPVNRAEDLARERFGITVGDITQNRIRTYGLYTDSGVVILDVESNSPAAEIGLEPGDVIRQMGSSEIRNMEDFSEAAVKAIEQEAVFAVVQRGRYLYYIRL